MNYDVRVECPVFDSFRVQQVCGMFGLEPAAKAQCEFHVEIPTLEDPWNLGLIVGPSGSGKSTVARHAFGTNFYQATEWPSDQAVVDAFPEGLSIREIVATFNAVGFSSTPAWVKPYHVLSNGERFRCDLARAILGEAPLVAYDEFTSLVDRTVAKIGSAAIAKAIRKGRIQKRFVAVTCHYDIAEWLAPDWIVDMATQTLARGSLCRPPIRLEIRRCGTDAWKLFQRHHYLSHELHKSARCFLGLIDGSPAAFCAVIHFPHPIAAGWKIHRVVVLPDFQGLSIGNALADYVGSLYKATGKPFRDVNSSPGLWHYRIKSPLWRCKRIGVLDWGGAKRITVTKSRLIRTATNRITASFEYVGPARPEEARAFGLNVPPALDK